MSAPARPGLVVARSRQNYRSWCRFPWFSPSARVVCPSRGNKRTIVRGAKGGLLPHLMMIACADVDETYGKRLTFCVLSLRISPLQTFILLVSTSRKPSMS